MKIGISQSENTVIVTVEGRLDTLTSSELGKALEPYSAEPDLQLILDCKDMDYISSSGLRIVLQTQKTLAARGGYLIIRNISKEVRSVFDMTGFSRILTIE